MIDSLKPYPTMKDSSVPWLGAMPEHWKIQRNGRLFRFRKQVGFPELPILEVSIHSGVRRRDVENSGHKQVMADRAQYQRAVRGDIAYNMMRMWQGAVGVVPIDGLVSPAYIVARPFEEVNAPYFAYLFRTAAYMREVENYSRGIVPESESALLGVLQTTTLDRAPNYGTAAHCPVSQCSRLANRPVGSCEAEPDRSLEGA